MGFFDFLKKKDKTEPANAPIKTEPANVPIPPEYEIEDITFIRDMKRVRCGAWEQYDILLDARPYGWEDMRSWAEYMSQNDVDVSLGTLTVSPIAGGAETELIGQYRIASSVRMIPELENEYGVLTLGGASRQLKAPVKIVWFNQTNRFRLFTLVGDETLMRRYIETVIRRSFGTPEEMKLAKPIPAGQ